VSARGNGRWRTALELPPDTRLLGHILHGPERTHYRLKGQDEHGRVLALECDDWGAETGRHYVELKPADWPILQMLLARKAGAR
jgi:hypothetical protein